MIAQEYIAEIKQRLDRKEVALEHNEFMILSCLNYARKKVFQYTYPIVPERYGITTIGAIQEAIIPKFRYRLDSQGANSIRDMYIVEFPKTTYIEDMVEIYTVVLYWYQSGTKIMREARELRTQEVFNVGKYSWNTPTNKRPTYTIEKIDNVNSLFIGGLETGTGTLFDIADDRELYVEVEYVGMVQPLTHNQTIDVFGVEFEELIIMETLAKLYQESNLEVQARYLMVEINDLQAMISQNYDTVIMNKEVELPSKEA